MKSLRAKGPTGVLLSPLPLFHSLLSSRSFYVFMIAESVYKVTGLIQIMTLPAHINQEVILMSRFHMKRMLDAIVKYKSDELWLVPRKSSCLRIALPIRRTHRLMYRQRFLSDYLMILSCSNTTSSTSNSSTPEPHLFHPK